MRSGRKIKEHYLAKRKPVSESEWNSPLIQQWIKQKRKYLIESCRRPNVDNILDLYLL